MTIRDVFIEGVRDAEKASGSASAVAEIPWLASQAVVTKVLRGIGQDEVADEIDKVTEARLEYMRQNPQPAPW